MVSAGTGTATTPSRCDVVSVPGAASGRRTGAGRPARRPERRAWLVVIVGSPLRGRDSDWPRHPTPAPWGPSAPRSVTCSGPGVVGGMQAVGCLPPSGPADECDALLIGTSPLGDPARVPQADGRRSVEALGRHWSDAVAGPGHRPAGGLKS